MSSLRSYVNFFIIMAQLKDPKLREITTQYPSITKQVKSLRYLNFLECRLYSFNEIPKTNITLNENEASWYICNDKGQHVGDIVSQVDTEIKSIVRHNMNTDGVIEYDSESIWQDYYRLAESERRKYQRIKQYINALLCDTCLFLTMTFTDDILNSTTAQTRRRYINDYLKSLNCKWIGNIDFGKLNGREHYHAIAQIDFIDTHIYKYGNLDVKKINLSSDAGKLANYINKLVVHSIKSTTHNCRIMKSKLN